MSTLDPQFFKPFIQGTLSTLKIQCFLEATPEKPFFKDKQEQVSIEIAGVIGLTSSAFNGTIALCFPAAVFLVIMSNMLGEKFGEITRDLEDGAAEMLNMIFGQAKVTLNEQGHNIEKAIPTVVRGVGIQIHNLAKAQTLVLPFKTSAGPFYVEICTEQKVQ